MKKILNSILLLAAVGTLLFSCQPMDLDQHGLGPAPEESQLAFSVTPDGQTPNIVVLKNTSTVAGVALWDLGNGTTVKGDEVSATYPFKGDYTVTMSLYTSGGSATISKVVSIAADDYGLLDTPGFNALTGGADATEGKTWVLAKYTAGHIAVDDINAAPKESGRWWDCPPLGKDGSSLYDNEYTFIQKGTKLIWKNQGSIYTNQAGVDVIGIAGVPNAVVGDFDVPYVPADNLTFTLDEDNMTLTLSDGAFMGFYCGASTFNIIRLTDHELTFWCQSVGEPGNAWYATYVPKDELKEPEVEPEPEPDPKPESEAAWFRPNAETNLLVKNVNYEQWFSGADWAGGLAPGISIKNDIVITVPEGIGGGEWMGQFKIKTGVPADARERFDFSCDITSTAAGTATVKMTSAADGDDCFFYDGNVAVAAGTPVNFEAADHMLFDATESILVVFDFGRFPAGSVITISNLCLQKHIPLSEKPQDGNLWGNAEVTVEEIYFSPADWSGGLDAKFELTSGNGFKLTVPEGIGGNEWQGQVKLNGNFAIKASNKYTFSCTVKATAEAPFTIKLTNNPEADEKVCFYDNELTLKNGDTTVNKPDLSPEADAEAAFLIFDFGRVPAGTEIEVTDIVIKAE